MGKQYESVSNRSTIDKYMNKRSTLLLFKTTHITSSRWGTLHIKLSKTITHWGCLDIHTLLHCSEHKLTHTFRGK